MSDSVDRQIAAAQELDRWRRMEAVFADLSRVAKMKREGMPLPVIAMRLGWSERTLLRWLAAVRVMERKGIEMARVER